MDVYHAPPLYQPWIEALLPGPVPNEERATCSECAMCKQPELSAPSDYLFHPGTKCCAYLPTLPNFLVGGILSDQSPSFAHHRELFIKEAIKGFVIPLGIQPPNLVQIVYRIKDFGKDEALRCPFYLWYDSGGKCAIWQYRNSVCFTYFCRYNRGIYSFRFWKQLDKLLTTVEKGLAQWCVDSIGIVIPENPSSQREAFWGNWAEKEAEFFLQCWLLVKDLCWSEALDKAGAEGKVLAQSTIEAYREMMFESFPARLQSTSIRCEPLQNGSWRVWGFSRYDPIDLPEEIVSILNYFDGRHVTEVLQHIKKDKGVDLDAATLKDLIERRILAAIEG